MLNAYAVERGKLKLVEDEAEAFWLDADAPEPGELKKLADRHGVPMDYLTDSLDPSERPHAIIRENMVLVIARVSVQPKEEEDLFFETVPLGVIITPEKVVTVCRKPGLARFLMESYLSHGGVLEEKGGGTRPRPGLMLALAVMQQSSVKFIKHLQALYEASGQIEQSMLKSMSNEELIRMMRVEKTLVYFLTSLKGNVMLMEKMQSSPILKLQEAEAELLVDALTECRQAEQMAEVYSGIVSSVSNTFASMVSNNMNSVVKFLTAITLILMAPTIIVGLYGMNVPLPFQESAWTLPLLVVVTFGVCWGLWVYLSRKHWM